MDYLSPRERPGLDKALNTITSVPEVLAGVVAAEDGLPIAVRLQPDHDAEVWAVAAAAMGRLSRKVLRRLAKGELEVSVFDTGKYRLIVRPVSVGYVLAVCQPGANLGVIAGELDAAARALDQESTVLLSRPVPDAA